MPVFDFNNTPEEGKTPECTYTVFYSSEQEASTEYPMLVLDNSKGKLQHHSIGVFTNPVRPGKPDINMIFSHPFEKTYKTGINL